MNLYVNQLTVPGTGGGTLPDDKVYDYLWKIPSGWSMNGYTSDGSTLLPGGTNVRLSYPASTSGGTIEVMGYHAVATCEGAAQKSKTSKAITINRDPQITIAANKSYFLCGSTEPITFTVSPALSCAVYYWNNSTTATTSNTFSMTPGTENAIATVKIVYAGKEKILSKTVPVKLFDPGVSPQIIGNPLCYGSETYSVPNLRPGYWVNWTCSNNLNMSQQTGTNSCTFSVKYPGEAWVQASIHTNCGNGPVLHKEFMVGTLNSSYLVSSRHGQAVGAWAEYRTLFNSGQTLVVADYGQNIDGVGNTNSVEYRSITGYEWNFPSGWSYSNTYQGLPNQYINVYPNWGTFPQPGQAIQVGLRVQNDCGWSDWKYDYWQIIPNGSYYMTVSPNPVSSFATIELQQQNNVRSLSVEEPVEWEVEVFSQAKMAKVKSIKTKEKKFKINTQGMPEGMYFIRAKSDSEIILGKLIVKH